MPIKVKYTAAIKYLKGTFSGIQSEFRKQAEKEFGKELNEKIMAGTSPVKGQGRFPEYSVSYKLAIQTRKKYKDLGKRLRPVNLNLKGDLLDSQRVSISDKDGVKVAYTDKKAVWHNTEGAGKSKVLRRMLPTNKGEEFSQTLMRTLKKLAATAAAKIIGRSNQ